MFSSFFFNGASVYWTMWKNVIDPDRLQMTVEYGACALHAG